MKVDTSGIDTTRLVRQVNNEYGLDLEVASFVPKGEEAYGYAATGRDGGVRHFIRAQ
ncbi:MAG: hypothetical protein AVDCRST_MAG88-1833 [uncultured Thermomicrobiales bacterium]|uniref:Uncharacterized protein n=1 Tax=uncultured Thermomicrobiales bacterium TaxID=1645740 RepID=A0A6J4V5H6_9BACT|nr:MAG: hypothetical protein AVDCRST_MAG88-1833 [uncultured Thermomicrobiales bacterium]